MSNLPVYIHFRILLMQALDVAAFDWKGRGNYGLIILHVWISTGRGVVYCMHCVHELPRRVIKRNCTIEQCITLLYTTYTSCSYIPGDSPVWIKLQYLHPVWINVLYLSLILYPTWMLLLLLLLLSSSSSSSSLLLLFYYYY